MAKTPDRKGRGGAEESPPTSYAQTTPEFAQPGHDFTLQAVMQLQKSVGEMGAKLDAMTSSLDSQKTKLGEIEKVVDRVRTGAIVAGVIMSGVAVVFWWAIGDRITLAVRSALLNPPPGITAPAKQP